MTEAVGPIYAAGDEFVSKSGYVIMYLPDLHNDELQREGKSPVYYWLPNTVRLARKPNGYADFHLLHFEGVRSGDANVGVTGQQEVAGGILSFSTTSAPPSDVLQEAHQELLNRMRGKDDKYWGLRTSAAPMFRPAPIVSNTLTISNIAPTADGGVPAVTPAPAPGPAPAGGGRALNGHAPSIRSLPFLPGTPAPRSVPMSRGFRASNLSDPMFVQMQGAGNGSVSPLAENAYSALMGSIPTAIMWSSFHGSSSNITVWQNMMLKVWSPAVHLLVEGDWDRVQDHFSAAAHGGGLFWSADIQAEFNSLRTSGGITVKLEVDTTIPNSDKLQEQLEKRSDLVFQTFMDQAKKVIFDPAPFTEKPAEASGGFLGFGGGAAFKLRRDQTHLHLRYEETRQFAYLQSYPISGELDGLADEIKANPDAEKQYFTTLYLGDWERKVTRIVKPVVNWPDPTRKWVGEPVAFLSVQCAYPNTQGELQWTGHVFQSTDPPDASWNTAVEMKAASDVSNPPAGWTPDKMYVKRQIHFSEPPNETENPFVRVSVEQNVVDLDPGDNGLLSNDINLEVRVDNAGVLNVGPVMLGVDLENAAQVVEVSFKALGQTTDGHDRAPVKFGWQYADQTEPRYWMVFTGQPDFVPKYQYQVRVVVKGSIFTKGMEWTGPWVDGGGNGPLMVTVPTPEDDGVTVKKVVPFGIGVPAPAAPPAGAGRPPGVPAAPPVAAAGAPPAGHAAPGAQPPAKSGPAQPPAPRETVFEQVEGWTLTPPAKQPADRGAEPMFTGFSESLPSD